MTATSPLMQVGAVRHRRWRSDIDALRVLAVLLVLVVHSAMVYSPWQDWHVQNDGRSKWLAELTLLPGPWLMGLFMLLAGRSAFYSLESRTDRVYITERITRLFIPLVAGTFLLVPPMMYVRRTLEGRYAGSLIGFYPRFFDGLYPEGNLSWGHLWFLAYLLLYGILLLPLLRRLQRSVSGQGLDHRRNVVGLIVFVVLCGAAQVALRARFPQTNALIGDWANHAQLVPAFLLGFVLAASSGLEATLDRLRHVALALACAASTIIGLYAWPGIFGDRLPSDYSWSYAAFWFAESLATWMWIFAITAYAKRRVTRETAWLSRAREEVYPFYVLHQPVLVFVAWKLVPLDLPILPEFLLVLATALLVTILSCELARLWLPARVILGMRRAGDAPAAA